MNKRVVIISDKHCGHAVGLTPPTKWVDDEKSKLGKTQRAIWSEFQRLIYQVGKPDLLIVNGDSIDGKGVRSGGTEQTCADPLEQVDWALFCVRYIKAKNHLVVAGTPYHVGISADYETLLAQELECKFGGHEWADVNGTVFDCKHTVGSSGIPHGRATAISRERLWSEIWAEREEAPKSDVIIRSHVHYHSVVAGPGWMAMTTPAMCGKGSKFGVRQCSGLVDFGLVVFDVYDKPDKMGRKYEWAALTKPVKQQQAKAVKF